jgi:Na+-transporting methylmalonyl-CoA/oxaloacetate decarboxylase gamma subunit
MMNTIILDLVPAVVETGSNWPVFLFFGILAVCVVLFIYFLRRTDRILQMDSNFQMPSASKKTEKTKDLHGEEAAAIALAIHLYQSQLHDMESFTITLQKVSRIYSPWSSKIYSLRQNPRS